MSNKIHVNEIFLKGEDEWTKQFNRCSELWQKSNDSKLTEEERKEAGKMWFEERQRLELGMF